MGFSTINDGGGGSGGGASGGGDWAEGRFPGTQLAGSFAVEQRRNT